MRKRLSSCLTGIRFAFLGLILWMIPLDRRPRRPSSCSPPHHHRIHLGFPGTNPLASVSHNTGSKMSTRLAQMLAAELWASWLTDFRDKRLLYMQSRTESSCKHMLNNQVVVSLTLGKLCKIFHWIFSKRGTRPNHCKSKRSTHLSPINFRCLLNSRWRKSIAMIHTTALLHLLTPFYIASYTIALYVGPEILIEGQIIQSGETFICHIGTIRNIFWVTVISALHLPLLSMNKSPSEKILPDCMIRKRGPSVHIDRNQGSKG